MAREPIPSWYFVLVVVRKDDKFLLVHERKHEQKWYLPRRIEVRETFIQAAHRETMEETGVPIIIEGVLGIQHTPILDGTARVRFILLARPEDETPPKSEPDDESLEAAWMTLEEMTEVELRGAEVLQIFEYVASGGAVYPLDLITTESPLYYGQLPTKK